MRSTAFAQSSDDVPPPPVPPPVSAATPTDAVGEASSNVAAPPVEARSTDAGAGASSLPASSEGTPDGGEVSPDNAGSETKPSANVDVSEQTRLRSLEVTNTLYGPSGLLRIVTPDSGEAGTFRFSIVGSFFSSRGFLCPECSTRDGDVDEGEDSAAVFSQRFALSVTPIDFVEGTVALGYRQAKNSEGQPNVVQISGDTMLGVRAFLPPAAGMPVGFGGGVLVDLLKRPNGIGVGATNVALHLEGALDLSRLQSEESAAPVVPVRLAANVAYEFDNSAAMIEGIEADRSEEAGSRQRITRVERFGWDIDRVDSVRLGLGAEGLLKFVRPFAEWSIDLPANRQGYTCYRNALSADDECMTHASFADIPSRLTLGARGYPWFASFMQGISLFAAVDIATGGSSSFLEEVAPEQSWNLYLGLGYAVDTHPRVKTVQVEQIRTVTVWGPPDQVVGGSVLDTATQQPIAEASVLFANGDRQGMLTDSQGRFVTKGLEPGSYTFSISKEGYGQADCSVTVAPSPETAPHPSESPRPIAPTPPTAPIATSEAPDPPAPIVTPLVCRLEELPARGDVEGALRDARTQEYVSEVNVMLTDPRGRNLSIATDERGAFRFENVPEGASRLEFDRAGYVPSSAEVEVKRQGSTFVQISLQPSAK